MQLKLETCAGVLGHWHRPQRDDKSSRPAHIRPMAKSPDSRKGKDPARPTRAKAAREPLAPIAPALEQLLNPGIAKGTAASAEKLQISRVYCFVDPNLMG